MNAQEWNDYIAEKYGDKRYTYWQGTEHPATCVEIVDRDGLEITDGVASMNLEGFSPRQIRDTIEEWIERLRA